MYFMIRGRSEIRQEQITAVKTSIIDQRVRSTSSPIFVLALWRKVVSGVM